MLMPYALDSISLVNLPLSTLSAKEDGHLTWN